VNGHDEIIDHPAGSDVKAHYVQLSGVRHFVSQRPFHRSVVIDGHGGKLSLIERAEGSIGRGECEIDVVGSEVVFGDEANGVAQETDHVLNVEPLIAVGPPVLSRSRRDVAENDLRIGGKLDAHREAEEFDGVIHRHPAIPGHVAERNRLDPGDSQ
jgi:hypothetical protein